MNLLGLKIISLTGNNNDRGIYVSGNDSELIQKKINADILEVHN